MKRVVFLLLYICLSLNIFGATYTWDGGASTTNWEDGNNWNPDAAAGGPVNGDIVTLTTGNIVVTSALVTVSSLIMNGTASLTLGSNGITINGNLSGTGTFNGGSGTVTVNGDSTVSNFTASSGNTTLTGDLTFGGIFTHSGGTFIFDGTGNINQSTTFNNLTISGTAVTTIPGAYAITVDGTFNHLGTINVDTGTLDLNAATTLSAGTINITTGTLDVSTNGASVTGSSIAITGSGTINSTGQNFPISLTGSVSLGNGSATLNAGTLPYTNGTLNGGNGTINVNGDVTITGASFTAPTNFNITNTADFNPNGNTFNNLTTSVGTVTLANDITINNDLTISSGILTTGDNSITINGSATINGTFDSSGQITGGNTTTINGVVSGTGTLTGGSQTITIGSITSLGTLTGGSGAIDVNGNATITTFNEGTGNTNLGGDFAVTNFTDNATGTLIFDGAGTTIDANGQNLGNIEIATDRTLSNALTCGNLTINNLATLTTGTNNLTCNNLLLNGTGTLLASGQGGGNSITINGTATGSGILTCGAGTLDVNGEFNITGNTTFSSVTSNIGGNFTATGATFDANGGTIIFDGAGTTIDSNGQNLGNIEITIDRTLSNALTCGNLTINNLATLTTGSNNLTCNNLLLNGTGTLFASGQVGGNSITINGSATDDVSNTGTLTGGDGAITINGDLDINTVTASSGNTTLNGANVTLHTFTHSSGTVELNGTNQALTTGGVNFNNLTVSSGAGTVITTGTVNVGGNLTINAGDTLDCATNNSQVGVGVDLTDNGTLTTGTQPLSITGSATGSGILSCGVGTLNVDGDFNITGNTTLSSASSTIGGAFTATGASYTNTGTLTFDGTSGANINANNKNLGNVIVSVNKIMTGAMQSNDLTISSGTLTTDANNLSITGNLILDGTLNSSGQGVANSVSVTGNVRDTADTGASGTFTSGSGNVSITGYIKTNNFTASSGNTTLGGNLTVSGTFSNGGAAATFIFDGTTIINQDTIFNNLTLAAGSIVDISNRNITVNTNFKNSGATSFTVTNSTVTLASANTATISGDTTFNNLSCTENGKTINITGSNIFTNLTVNSSGGTVNFDAGTTQTVNTFLDLQGAVGGMTSFLNLTGVGVWDIIAPPGQTVQYVNVTNSDASGGNQITPSDSKNSTPLTNSNWSFVVNNFQWLAVAVDNNWNNPSNWNLGFYPNDGDNVTINPSNFDPTINITTVTLNDLTITATAGDFGQLSTGNNTLIVNGNLTINNNGANYGTLRIYDPSKFTANTVAANTGTIEYYGAVTQAIDYFIYQNLVISGAGGSFSLSGVTTVNGFLTVSNGTLDASTNNISIAGNVTINGGTLNATGRTVNASGNWTHSSGTFTNTGSTVIFDGATASVNVSEENFNNLTLAKTDNSKVIIATGIWTVSGTLTLTNCNLSPGNFVHDIRSSWDDSAIIFQATTGTINFATNSLNITNVATNYFYNFTIDVGLGNTATLKSNININGNLSIASGTLDAFDSVGRTINLKGTWTNAGTFTNTSSTVRFIGSSGVNQDITTGGIVAGKRFNNIEIATTGGTTVRLLSSLQQDAGGVLTMTSGTLNLNAFIFYLGSNFTQGAGTLTIGTGTFNGYDGTATYYDLTFNSGMVTHGAFPGTLRGKNILINGGTYNLSADSVFDVHGDFTILGAAAWSVNCGDITMNSGGNIRVEKTAGNSIRNLTVNTSGTVLISTSDLFMSGNFLFQANTGTFNQNGQAMTVGGTFTLNNGSTYTAGTGALNVAGDFTLNATSTFNAGGVLTFNGTGNLTDNNGTKRDLGAVVLNTAGNRTQTTDILTTSLTINVGRTYITGAFNLAVIDDLTVLGTGALNASSQGALDTISIGGDASFGTFSKGSGTVIFNGGDAQSFTPNSMDFGNVQTLTLNTIVTMTGIATMDNLTIDASTTFQLNGAGAACTLNINDTKTVANSGIFKVFDSTNAVTLRSASGTANFTGTDIDYGGNKIYLSGIDYQTNMVIDTSETVQLSGACTIDSITINNTGTFINGGFTTTIDNADGGGNAFKNNASGIATLTGTVIFSGTVTQKVTSGVATTADLIDINHDFTNLTHSGNAELTLIDGIQIDGIFNHTSVNNFNMNSQDMAIGGNVTFTAGTFTNGGTGKKIYFTGTTDFRDSTAGQNFGNIEIKSGNSLTLNVACTSGIKVNDITINGTFTDNAETTHILGNYDNTSGTVTLTGIQSFEGTTALQTITAGGTGATKQLRNVVHSNTSTQNLRLIDSIKINGYFDNQINTFDMNNQNINVGGNFTLALGTLVTNAGGTLTFDGTTNFYDYTAALQNVGNVVVSGAGGVTLQTDAKMTDLTINGTRTLTTQDNALTVSGNLTIYNGVTQGKLDASGQSTGGKTVTVSGTVSCDGNITEGTQPIYFNGTTVNFTTNGTFTKNTSSKIVFSRAGSTAFNLTTSAPRDFGNVQTSTALTSVTMTGVATMDDLIIDASTTFQLNGAGAACTLNINDTKTVANSGIFKIFNSTNAVTLRSVSGTAIFTGTDIDYGGNKIYLSGINYSPAVDLSTASETIELSGANCTFTSITIGTGGIFDDGGQTFNITGNWVNTNGTCDMTGTAIFSGGVAQTITSGGTGAAKQFNNLVHNGTGTLEILLNAIYIKGYFTNSTNANTFDLNGFNMTVVGNFTVSAGTFNASDGTPTIYVGGNWSSTGGSFTEGTGSIVDFNNTTGNITNPETFYHLKITAGSHSVTGGNIIVSGNLALSSSTTLTLTNAYTLSVTGDTDNYGTITSGTGTGSQTYTGTFTNRSGATVRGGTGGTAGSLTFNGNFTSEGSVNCGNSGNGNNGLVFNGTATFNSGTLVGNATTNPNIRFTGTSIDFNGLTTLTQNSDLIVFSGAVNQDFNSGGITNFTNIEINKSSGSVILQSPLTLTGTLTITLGTLDANVNTNTITIGTNFLNTGGIFLHKSNTVIFNTAVASSLRSGNSNFYNLTISKTGIADTVTLSTNNLTVDNTFTMTSGTFGLGSNDLTLSASPLLNTTDGRVNLNGRTITATGVDIEVNGTYFNHTNAGGSVKCGNFKLTTGDVNHVTGPSGISLECTDFTVSGGTYNGWGTTIKAAGDVLINGGTFKCGTSTITMTGASKNITCDIQNLYSLTIDTTGNVTQASNNLNITGSFTNSGSFTHNNKKINFKEGNAQSFYPGSSTYYDITVAKSGGTLTLQSDDLTAVNDISITGGTFSTGSKDIYLEGKFSNSGTFTAGTRTLFLTGTNDAQTINAGGSVLNNLTINKTANTNIVTLPSGASDLTINGVLTITKGVFIQNRNLIMANTGNLLNSIDITANGTWRNITGGTNCNITLGGTVTNGNVNNLGLINFDGGASKNLQIRSSGGNQRDWKGGGTFTVGYVDVQDQTAISGIPAMILCADGKPGTDSGNNINWFLGSDTVTLSGSVYLNNEVTTIGASENLTIVVSKSATVRSIFNISTDAAGDFLRNKIPMSAGDIIMVYENGASQIASTVSVASGSSISSFDLFRNHVIIRNDNGGYTTNTNLDRMVNTPSLLTGNYRFSVANATKKMTLESGYELYIWNNGNLTTGYSPDGDVTTQGVGGNIDIRGHLIDNGHIITLSGNWDNIGGKVTLTGTAIFNGAAQTINAGGTSSDKEFYNLTHHSSATGSLSLTTTDMRVKNTFLNDGNNFSMNTQNMNVGGNFTISLGTTFTKGGATNILTFDGTGSFTFRDSAGNQNVGNVVINSTETLSIYNTAATSMTADNIRIDGTLTTNNMNINCYGNFTNNNTFNCGTGTATVSLLGASAGTFTLKSNNSSFNHITINKTVASNAGIVQLNTNDLSQIATGVLTVTSGTLDLNSLKWTLGANLNLTAGSTGLVAIGTGILDGGSTYNVEVATGSVTHGTTGTLNAKNLTVSNIYTCSGNSVINLNGNLNILGSNWTASTSKINFNTAGTITTNQNLYNVEIKAGAGNTVTLLSNVTQTNPGTLTMSSGELQLYNGATPYTWTLGNDLNMTSTATMDIGIGVLTGGTAYNVTFDTNSTVTHGTGTLTAKNISIIGSATYTCNTTSVLNCNGDFVLTSSGWTRSSSTVYMSETGIINASQTLNNLNLNPSSAKTITITTSSLNVGGTLTTNANSSLVFPLLSSLTLSVTGTTTNGGVITGANTSGTMTFTGGVTNTGSITGGGDLMWFKSTLTSTSGSVTCGAVTSGNNGLEVDGVANFTGSTLNGNGITNPTLTFNNNLTFGTFNHNNDKVVITNGTFTTNNQNLYNLDLTTGTIGITGVLNVHKDLSLSSATVNPESTVNVYGNLTIPSGTLNLGTLALNIGANSITPSGLDISGTGVITLSNGQIITFQGDQDQTFTSTNAGMVNFKNIVVNKSSTKLLTLPNTSQNLIFDQNLTITSGVFVQNRTITLTGASTIDTNGEWRNVADNADADINLNNTLTINGGGKWNFNANTNAKTLTVGNPTITNNGTIIFDGNDTTDNINIVSSVLGTRRSWNGSGSFTMNDVTVEDQERPTGLTPVYISHDGTHPGVDNGNNINWRIGDKTIEGVVYQDKGVTNVGVNYLVRLEIYRAATGKRGYFDATTDDAGKYTFDYVSLVAAPNNDIIMTYLYNPVLPVDPKGNTVSIANGVDINNFDIYNNNLICRDESGNNITNATLSTFNGVTGRLYTVTGGNLSVNNDIGLFVWTGDTFRPSGNVTTQGTGGVDIRGTFTNEGNTLTSAGDMNVQGGILNATGSGNIFCSGGTVDFTTGAFTKGTGIFTFNRGNTQLFYPNSTTTQDFGNVTLSTNATVVRMNRVAIMDNLNISANTTFQMDGTTGVNTLNINNTKTVTNNGIFQVYNDTNSVTLKSQTGIANFTVTDFDYNGKKIFLNGINYSPAVDLNNNEKIQLSGANCSFTTININAGGEFIDGGQTFNITGNWSNAGTSTMTGTAVFNGVSQNINGGGFSVSRGFYNLTHSGTGSLQLITSALEIKNNFLNSANNFNMNGQNLYVGKNFTLDNGTTFTNTAAIIHFYGSSLFTDDTNTENVGNITVDNGSSLTLSTAIRSADIIIDGTGSLTNSGNTITLNGDFQNNTTGKFIHTGIIDFAGSSDQTITTAGIDINHDFVNLIHSGNSLLRFNDDIRISGYFNNTGGTTDQNDKNLYISGNFTLASGTLYNKGFVGNGLITFEGATNFYDNTATIQNIGNILIYNGKTLSLYTNMRCDDITINSTGVFTDNAKTIYTNGDYINNGVVSFTGTLDFTGGAQTLTSGGETAAKRFNNLIHSGSGVLDILTNNVYVKANLTNSSNTLKLNALDLSVIGNILISGGVVDASETNASSDSEIYLSGNWTDTGTFTSGNSTVFINGTINQTINAEPGFNNLIFIKSSGNALINGNVTSGYIALYKGGLTFTGGQTLQSTGDILFMGANAVDSLSIDGWGGPTRLFDPLAYTGSFNAGNGTPTIRVAGDFYVNGCNMTGDSLWNLNIPDNNSDTVRKARAYGNINVSYSVSNNWVSAIEPEGNSPKDLGNNVKWDFIRAKIISVETVSDKVIKVVFNKLIENTDKEISNAVLSGKVRYNNPNSSFASGIAFSGVYRDQACSLSTDTSGDMITIYLKGDSTWNTDASGDNSGNTNSTDRDGVHKTIVPNISFEKGAFRDNHKNQMNSANNKSVLDKCSPVLLNAVLGNETEGVNTFNYLRLTYSEPLMSPGITATPKNSDDGTTSFSGISGGNIGGGLTSAGVFKGFGSTYTKGDITTYSDSKTGTTDGRDDSNTVYKDSDNRIFTIRLGGNISDGGCLRGSEKPSGSFTSLTNIKDLRGNNLVNSFVENTTTVNYTPLIGYTPSDTASWNLTPPDFVNIDTDEKGNLTNGFIDNLIIDFDKNVQIYDNEIDLGKIGNSTIIWDSTADTEYTVSNHNNNKSAIKDDFNLDLIENTITNIYGDTDSIPVFTYRDNSNFKIISNIGRVEMSDNSKITAVDKCNPVLTKVTFGIDDPVESVTDIYYAPFIRQWKGDTKSEDPGTDHIFSLSTIDFPNKYKNTNHNYILFRYSEPISNFSNVPIDSLTNGYEFDVLSQSRSNFGDFTTDSKVIVEGFGSFTGDIKVDAKSNFIQREDNRTTYLHVAGFYDGTKFVGHITNQSQCNVPNSTANYYFTTFGNNSVNDYKGFSLIERNVVGNKDVTIDYTKNWDITPPDFRYIKSTLAYRGDPSSSDGSANLSCGATYGSPLISTIEFAMTEAVRDLPTDTDMSGAFTMKFYKNTIEYDNPTVDNLRYSTNVDKLGDIINDYNGTPQADGDVNDQGISIRFKTAFGMNDESQIKWKYTAVSGKILSDLRGNMASNVTDWRMSLENAPPYIKETRSVVGSNKMYVEFNEPVLGLDFGDISPEDFIYVDNVNLSGKLTLSGIDKINNDRAKYIFTFTGNLDQNHIVEDIISIKPKTIQDTLNNLVIKQVNNPLSYIGINFFTDITLEDYLHQGDNWKVTNFNGDEKISVENMRVTAKINVNKYKNFRPILYFDVRSDSKVYWAPNDTKEKREARMVLGNSKGNNQWEFIIPSSDSEIKSGNLLSFLFKIGDLYCYRSPYSLDSPDFTPYGAETFMALIQDIKLQNNNVTILNNVINPNNGEVTKLLYNLNNEGPVSIVVYDLAGDAVKVLKGEAETAGDHIVTWDGKNENGKIVTRGVYFIRVRAPGIFNQIRKVLIVK